MKKITFYTAIFAFVALFSSCEETESVIYNPGNGSSDVLVSFASSTASLPITVDATGSVNITVNVSSLSTEDRTVDLMVGEPTTTPAIEGSFMVPSTVTIPANSYTGTFTINGTDVPGVDTNARTFTVSLVDTPNFSEGGILTVSAFQICPVPSSFFTGNYQLTNLTQLFAGRQNFRQGIFAVTAPTETTRVFTTSLLGTVASPGNNVPVTLNLICNEIILGQTGPSPGLSCQAGGAPPVIRYGAATNPSPYDVNGSDDTIIINFDFDILSSCGNPEQNQSFIMVKQ